MPSYSRIVKIPGKSAKELFDVVSKDIDNFLSKAPMIGKYEVTPNQEKNNVQVKGSMFSALLSCREGEMEANVQLSLLAAPFKSKLDEGITHWLEKKFNLKNLA